MSPHKESSGRGRRRTQLTQYEGETDEDYRRRRERNNEAVRRSRDKSKKKTEETLKRVEILKQENCRLEEKIKSYRDQLQTFKDVFLQHAANGEVSADINIEALLKESDDLIGK